MSKNCFALLAVPTSVALISFLGYGSQLLFYKLEPGPFKGWETLIFNCGMFCIFISYLRACYTNPGWVPRDWQHPDTPAQGPHVKSRSCGKCNANKPARAHHCKICGRCIPKMDHHCPWTINCVSHRTFPHFFRFLLYSVITMTYLEFALFSRAILIWDDRHQPSYLGPSATQLVFLFIEITANSFTLFGVGLLFLRNLWCLASNMTTIEGWEVERHEALVRKARRNGGYLDGPDGMKVHLTKQEFPFDIGIFINIAQGMTGSVFFWLLPFAPTASNESGLCFETNGFDDWPWPPPDPDRMPRRRLRFSDSPGFLANQDQMDPSAQIRAFRHRQMNDLKRRQQKQGDKLYSDKLWTNSEGERLDDFGVDEEGDVLEDNIVLSDLIQRRKHKS